MTATWADDIFICNFVNEIVSISIKIPPNFVPKGLIDNKWWLVQVMACHQTGHKPLPEPMMTQFNDAYRCYPASMSKLNEETGSWHKVHFPPYFHLSYYLFSKLVFQIPPLARHVQMRLLPRKPWKPWPPSHCNDFCSANSRPILGLHPVNERCHYKVTPSLIGWAQT